jgi:hypothetical protein
MKRELRNQWKWDGSTKYSGRDLVDGAKVNGGVLMSRLFSGIVGLTGFLGQFFSGQSLPILTTKAASQRHRAWLAIFLAEAKPDSAAHPSVTAG